MSTAQTIIAQPGPGFDLQSKVSELSTAILEKHPRMPTLLREIHTTLRQYPENVTLLSEEEIGVIVSGLIVQTGVNFAASVSKPTAVKSATAKIKQLGIGAF